VHEVYTFGKDKNADDNDNDYTAWYADRIYIVLMYKHTTVEKLTNKVPDL